MIESAEEFVRLRTSDVREEYWRAAHEEAPIEIWLEVIARFPHMKKWVIHNKTVPLTILNMLSGDPDAEVRSWVAMKRKLDRELFEKLASDPDPGVRHSVALNLKTPLDILERLTADSADWLAETARERLADRQAELERRRRASEH